MKILLDQTYDTSGWTFYKHDGSDYNAVSGVTYGTQDVGGTDVTTINYTVTDGGTNDQDGVANGTIEDPAGIGADGANPLLSSSSPADDAVDVALDANIVLTMDETVVAGSGNISIYETTGDVLVEAIDVGSVSISTDTVTIDPSSDLSNSTEYYVLVAATALDDSAGNSYAGISNTEVLSFTTEAAPIVFKVTTDGNSDPSWNAYTGSWYDS